jgi:hypothetical protein
MSTDFSIRPVGTPVSTPVVQPVSAAAVNATATELPAAQAVTAPDSSARLQNNTSSVSSSVSSLAFFDHDAGSLVYQAVNDRTGAVVSQFPDDAILRRLAYFRAMDLAKDAEPRGIATDRNV